MTRFCNTATRTTLALLAALLFGALPAAAALVCTQDVQGVNDEPGQKDLTQFCTDTSAGTFDIITDWNWDTTGFNGNNTGDACSLYDTNSNGMADYVVCVTVQGTPTTMQQFRLFSCNDTRADRCSGATQLVGPFTTTCEAAVSDDDPFPAGEDYPHDTKAVCHIEFDDFFSGASAALLNACSYPSTEPNSDPSDCVAYVECTTDIQCSDGDACTSDMCVNNVCVNDDISASCDDGNVCNGTETCDPASGCVNGTPLTCDDGVFCDGVETCDPKLGCQDGPNPTCDDNVSCTTDLCDSGSDSCQHTPVDSLCDNGLFCDGSEVCDATLGCQDGPDPNCDDGVSCTTDSCNEGTDSCDHSPNDSVCSDNDVCTGNETCDPTNGCQAGTPLTCDDNNVCNGAETCDPTNGCQAGTPLTCDDNNVCNGVETCDATNGCQAGSALACDDGVFCNGAETCDPLAGCEAGAEPACEGDACNEGFCNSQTDTCDTIPINEGGSCGDDTSNACTAPDTCDAYGVCQPNNEPCGAITDSALCLFDTSTKGICVDNSSIPTGNACDTTGALECPEGETCVEENQFRLLFTPAADALPGYKLNASNPGQFYYNLVSNSPNCEAGVTEETFEIKVPFPFVTQGAQAVHVYDGELVGNAVGDDCFMPPPEALASYGLTITTDDYWDGTSDGTENLSLNCNPAVNGIDQVGQKFCTFKVTAAYPASCQLYLNVHLDYGLKGKDANANPRDSIVDRYDRGGLASFWNTYDALKHNDANIAISDCRDHPFSHEELGTTVTFSDNAQNLNDFAKVPPGVFGRVFDSDTGTGSPGLTVKLLDENGNEVGSAVTDDDGFYFIAYKHKGKQAPYEIEVETYQANHGHVELKGGNNIVEANFDVFTTTWSYN